MDTLVIPTTELTFTFAISNFDSAQRENFINEHNLQKFRGKVELSSDGDVICYGDKNQSSKQRLAASVLKVDRRPRSNILIVQCGLLLGTLGMVLFLDFNSSNEEADKWQKALCKITGQKYEPSVKATTLKRSKTFSTNDDIKHDTQRNSAFPDYYTGEENNISKVNKETHCQDNVRDEKDGAAILKIEGLVNKDIKTEEFASADAKYRVQIAEEGIDEFGTPTFQTIVPGTTPGHNNSDPATYTDCALGVTLTSNENPTQLSRQSSGGSQAASDPHSDSLPLGSLHSYIDSDVDGQTTSPDELDRKPENRDYIRTDLQGCQYGDYQDKVYIRSPGPGCKHNVGDQIELKDEQPRTAREVSEYLHTTGKKWVALTVSRIPHGVACHIKTKQKLMKHLRYNGEELALKGIITSVNNRPVADGTATEEVSRMLREAGDDLLLHLHHKGFIEALSSEDDKIDQTGKPEPIVQDADVCDGNAEGADAEQQAGPDGAHGWSIPPAERTHVKSPLESEALEARSLTVSEPEHSRKLMPVREDFDSEC